MALVTQAKLWRSDTILTYFNTQRKIEELPPRPEKKAVHPTKLMKLFHVKCIFLYIFYEKKQFNTSLAWRFAVASLPSRLWTGCFTFRGLDQLEDWKESGTCAFLKGQDKTRQPQWLITWNIHRCTLEWTWFPFKFPACIRTWTMCQQHFLCVISWCKDQNYDSKTHRPIFFRQPRTCHSQRIICDSPFPSKTQ